jgi:hypothetical protein
LQWFKKYGVFSSFILKQPSIPKVRIGHLTAKSGLKNKAIGWNKVPFFCLDEVANNNSLTWNFSDFSIAYDFTFGLG